MPVTPLELRRRQIALIKAVKANDNAKVRRLLKDCREWDHASKDTGRFSHRHLCFCCFKSDEFMSPARDAAIRTAIALGLRDMVTLIIDAGLQHSPRLAAVYYSARDLPECYSSTAVRFEQAAILRILLERNFISDEKAEQLAIRLAVSKGSLPLIEPFIEYGVVNQRRVVEIAMELGNLELVQALTEKSQSAPDLTVLLPDAELSAAYGHLDLLKYFVQQIRHKDENQVQAAALGVFKRASTVPILEFCMPLTRGLSDDDRNQALNNALSNGHTEAAGFLIQRGATHIPSRHLFFFSCSWGEPHFYFYAFMDPLGRGNQLVYDAIRNGFWNMIETCLRRPAFSMQKSYHHHDMVVALRCAVKDEQEKLLWHMIEHVPECRSILLTEIDFPIPRSPALMRISSRCRELLLPTYKNPASRWKVSALSDVFFNLILHSRLRPMETVVTPIGLGSETYTAAVAALRRICLLTMRLMADGNKDASLKQDLRHELVTCAALPGCRTILAYFGTTICTEALERNEPLLFLIIRDALTRPSYPDSGVFYPRAGLKKYWLSIAVEQGLHDVVRSLIPSSPAENVALYQSKGPSPKCSIRIGNQELWRSAVKRAIDEEDFVSLELLRKTQYTISGHDATELPIILLEPAFDANNHALLRYCRKIGVPYPHENFTDVLLPAIYHDLDPEKCTCANVSSRDKGRPIGKHTTMESICVYLGISEADLESDAMDTDEGELQNEGVLFADPTFIPLSSNITGASCRGSRRIAANYTTLVFNREGHAMCGDCLYYKFENAKRARWLDVGGEDAEIDEPPDDFNTDNIRVGCNTMQDDSNLPRIFPVTPSLQRVPFRDAELFLSQDDAFVYFDDKHQFAQPNLSGKLKQRVFRR
ncbi:hypothetical protein DFS34DRAFT_620946 [Phlyctochytrium arcticum]|nr:hypothetical protein DFS34DRAFT_620946 [Phlyctochytrium arcticum]